MMDLSNSYNNSVESFRHHYNAMRALPNSRWYSGTVDEELNLLISTLQTTCDPEIIRLVGVCVTDTGMRLQSREWTPPEVLQTAAGFRMPDLYMPGVLSKLMQLREKWCRYRDPSMIGASLSSLGTQMAAANSYWQAYIQSLSDMDIRIVLGTDLP